MIETIVYGGRSRRVQTITGTPSKPLVVILHSAYTTIEKMVALVDPSKFGDWNIVIPEALPPLAPRWIENPVTTPGDQDVDFINYVITRALGQTDADDKRVYVCGFSSGAFMTMRLLHESVGQRIRAAACVAGALLTNYTKPGWTLHPVPMLMFNGTADTNTLYGGQYGMLSAPDTAAYWARNLGWDTPSSRITLPDPVNDGTTSVATGWGQLGHEDVRLITIENGGHYWPGSSKNLIVKDSLGVPIGKVCMDLDATTMIRDWFAGR